MENKMLEILLGLQKDMKEVKTDIQGVKTDIQGVKTDIQGVKTDIQGVKNNLQEVKTDIQEIKETTKRIEVSQTEDVVGMLKMTKKKTDFEVDYLNNRLTEMDKRLFILEKRVEN